MDKARFAADLQWSGVVPIWGHPDLSSYAGRGKHALSAGVQKGEERRLLRPLRSRSSNEGDAHDWAINVATSRMRLAACWILVVGKDPREGTQFSQGCSYPRPTSSASCSCSVGTRRTLASRMRLERNCLNSASAVLAAATTSLPLRATHFPSSPRSISDRCRGSTAAPLSAGPNHIRVVLSCPAYN